MFKISIDTSNTIIDNFYNKSVFVSGFSKIERFFDDEFEELNRKLIIKSKGLLFLFETHGMMKGKQLGLKDVSKMVKI